MEISKALHAYTGSYRCKHSFKEKREDTPFVLQLISCSSPYKPGYPGETAAQLSLCWVRDTCLHSSHPHHGFEVGWAGTAASGVCKVLPYSCSP